MEKNIICPIDLQFANQISALLKPPSPPHVQEYFDELIRTRECNGIVVKQDGEFGKGVYANLDFGDGDLVLKDQILVGAQHSSNKIDCLVCSFCFKFIGSVELQIGRKLYLQDLDGFANHDCEVNYQTSGECSSSQSADKISLPENVVESLMTDQLVLPHSKRFSLPSSVSCPGGCQEVQYCSQLCADADWERFHSLLCPRGRSQALCPEALVKFALHAIETNDIFFLAAKVISSTILKYRKIKATPGAEQSSDFSLLLEAWKPISMGYKKRWWDCVALPDDVDPCEEAAFRMQIKDLAFTSLQLLKEAIFDKDCEPLFSLEIYGHIIGMFELNNLDLVVASPVEDYFLYIDDLPSPEKEEAKEVTQPILDALGGDYSDYCEGTAFFPLQSCMNHSCCPNAKAFKRDEDKDGQAIIIALRPIRKGEEITISYIDEELSFDERQALLADYGFRCKCRKCCQEEPK